MKIFSLIVGLYVVLAFQNVQAQRGYSKDSLQIKVYTEIIYKNSQVESLNVTRIFCDYCNDVQKKALKQEAWHRSYDERYSQINKLENGKRKLALYIRIAKEDFASLKPIDN